MSNEAAPVLNVIIADLDRILGDGPDGNDDPRHDNDTARVLYMEKYGRLIRDAISRQQSAQRDSSGAYGFGTQPQGAALSTDRPEHRTDTAQSTGAGVDLDSPELLEILADIEHERWSGWMKYMWVNYKPENITRWEGQSVTPYSELPEKHKESDRAEVRKTLSAIKDYLASQNLIGGGWRTIESADHSGEWILVSGPSVKGSLENYVCEAYFAGEAFHTSQGKLTNQPTHWQPLPSPPASTGERGE